MLHNISGEVVDHSELLDGEMQLLLEGQFFWQEKKYHVTNSLEWLMGNEIDIPILHSELLIENFDISTENIIGNYYQGKLYEDIDTGELQFDLSYKTDQSPSDEIIFLEITVRGNEWFGSLNISAHQLL
tara:strand:+ start:2024 stop:2410 length:387 start_codon:yes stop_codon:yes gene_type:complete